MSLKYFFKKKIPLFLLILSEIIVIFNFALTPNTFAQSPPWYDNNWLYRKSITIDNTSGSNDLIDYQVEIPLDSSTFDFSKARTNGEDLRFTENDGFTLLSHWIEVYDDSNKTATIWVKVPSIKANSTEGIYIYYGNDTIGSESSGENTFMFYDGFEERQRLRQALDNDPEWEDIPAYANPDIENACIHTGVVYFENGWNGYKYWLVCTPYAYDSEDDENPSMFVSNDNVNWIVPPGLTNPLVPMPATGYNSDPHLIHNDDTDELWVYYRALTDNQGPVGSELYEHIRLLKSSDGVNWSGPTDLITLERDPAEAVGEFPLVSPSVVKRGSNFYMWTIYTDTGCNSAGHTGIYRLERRTSSDGENWSAPETADLEQEWAHIWHPKVKYIPSKNEYWMTVSAFYSSLCTVMNMLHFAKSTDGLNWQTYKYAILPHTGTSAAGWDSDRTYTGDFIYDEDTDTIRVWYSGRGSFEGNWAVGYTERYYPDFYANLENNTSWSHLTGYLGYWNSSTDQVRRGNYSGFFSQSNSLQTQSFSHAFPIENDFYLEWDLYDDLDDTSIKLFRLGDSGDTAKIGLGVYTNSSTTDYVYHDTLGAYTSTSVSRTEGWHKFGILLQEDSSVEYFIDNESVGSLSGQFNDTGKIFMDGLSSLTPSSFYMDDMRVRGLAFPPPSILFGNEETIIDDIIDDIVDDIVDDLGETGKETMIGVYIGISLLFSSALLINRGFFNWRFSKGRRNGHKGVQMRS